MYYILHNHMVIFYFQLYIDLNTLMKGMGVNHRLYLRLLIMFLNLLSEQILKGKTLNCSMWIIRLL